MPIEDIARGLLSTAFLEGKNVLRMIEYANDAEKLVPKLVGGSSQGLTVSIDCVGRYKSTYWDFQHEWRYIMNIVPYQMLENPETSEARFNEMVQRMVAGTLAPPCSYYDLHIDPDAMRKVVITPSPKMSTGNKILLEALLNEQGLSDCLKSSSLEGML